MTYYENVTTWERERELVETTKGNMEYKAWCQAEMERMAKLGTKTLLKQKGGRICVARERV